MSEIHSELTTETQILQETFTDSQFQEKVSED